MFSSRVTGTECAWGWPVASGRWTRTRGSTWRECRQSRQEEVDVTEPVVVEIMGRHTSEEALVLGDEVLIGQTVLEKMDLHVDGRERRLLPNPAHPDQPVLKVK